MPFDAIKRDYTATLPVCRRNGGGVGGAGMGGVSADGADGADERERAAAAMAAEAARATEGERAREQEERVAPMEAEGFLLGFSACGLSIVSIAVQDRSFFIGEAPRTPLLPSR